MSYLELSKRNKINAEKAEALDNMRQQERDRQAYNNGVGDAYTSVEQELMRRMAPTRSSTPVPIDTPVTFPARADGLAAAMQEDARNDAYSRAVMRAQSTGDLSEANINKIVEEELSRV